jgi:hypothetical protein
MKMENGKRIGAVPLDGGYPKLSAGVLSHDLLKPDRFPEHATRA